MVIQRWQNLLLLISVIFIGIFCAAPTTYGIPVYFVLNITATILLIVAIALFKNLSRQISITNMSLILMCASIVINGFTAYKSDTSILDATNLNALLLIGATVCSAFATRFMRKDRALLRSYDRLR